MSKRAVRRLLWLALVGLLVAAPAAIAAPPQAAPEPGPLAPIDPYLFELIKAEGQARFDVVLKLQADLSGAAQISGKVAKGEYVYHALTAVAAETQAPLIQALKAHGTSYRSFWIQNMVRVWGGTDLLLEIAARPDVAAINYEYPAVPDQDAGTTRRVPTLSSATTRAETIEWNILRVNADDVWGMGITGEGAVIGDLDTGVQWDHPALKLHYRGCQDDACTTVDHNYNWYESPAGSQVPYDTGNHGTHTMGTIVGDDGAGNQIGMAPGAEWIACPGIGSPLVGPFECFEFFLAPTKLDGTEPRPDLAPHVISNSWSSSGTDYHAAIQALYAAGIFYSKSGGNTGSACNTITNPGQWPEVTAAAAFSSSDAIASFSSRGPVYLGHDAVMKPDIAAPGVNVRSSVPNNLYSLMSGTSMACPHVTGAVALLISANPELAGQIDILQKLLKQAAEPKIDAQCTPYVDHPNDVWGWGILDVYDAVVAAQGISLGALQGTVSDLATGAPIAGAVIGFEDSSGWSLPGEGGSDGAYAKTLPAGTYDLNVSAFGYLPQVDAGVDVLPAQTTVHDITMDAAPIWTVSGYVTALGLGAPLAATIVIDGTPLSAETDPATGFYSLEVPQGTYWFEVSSPGHMGVALQLFVGADMTQDFGLETIWNYPVHSSHDQCDPIAYNWMEVSDGTKICLTDDSYLFVSLPTGRTFPFYEGSYDGLYVGSNGIITFGPANNKWSGPIPDPAEPNNGVYAFSADLNPGSNCSQGSIYHKYVDGRYFVIQWDEVQHYPSGDPETFEIILDLDGDQIILQYEVVSNPTDVVAGVENAAGTIATQYAYGDPVLLSNETRVELDLVFGTPPAQGPGTIDGSVTDAQTLAPIEGATVQAVGTGGTFYAVTGPDGTYALDLCADSYTMSATAGGYYPSGDVVVDLAPAASVTQNFGLEPMRFFLYLPVVFSDYP